MNIWIFNHYAVGPGSSGGTRHYDLAKQLVQRGHKVTIFASSFNHQTLKEEHLNDSPKSYIEKDYNGVKFIWIKSTPYHKNDWRRVLNMLTYTIRAYRIAVKKFEKPDVVIGSLVHPLAAYLGYLISIKKNAIFYFEERDLWPQTLIDMGKFSEKNPIIWLLASIEKFLYKKSKRIILLFEKAIEYVESKGINKEKVILLPNGIDLSRFESNHELSNDLINYLRSLNHKIIAAYTGTHGMANNLDVILDAAKILQKTVPHLHFLFVGNGPEKTRLIERTKNEKINNITFLDPQPKEFIPHILKEVDVGLLPLKESPVFKWGISPNKLFDYMGASLPVILLCNLDNTPVDKSKGGKVIKKDFVKGIVDFFQNTTKEELRRLGENAYKYVVEEHNWSKLALKLEKQMLKDIEDEAK